MRRFLVMVGVAMAVAGAAIGVARSRVATAERWRARLMRATTGRPSGPLGWLSARTMALGHGPIYATMARELDLRPDDDLLDVGCGSAGLLTRHAAHVRHVAGLDVSEIQVGLARGRLAGRIAAGSAEIVLGDAAALPWGDGRFSVVTAYGCLEFVPDPLKVMSEMHRVLRPGGRAVVTLGLRTDDASRSGTSNEWGIRRWSEADARRLMEEAGFGDVSVSTAAAARQRDFFFQIARGTRQASPSVVEAAETPSVAQEART